MCSVSDLLRLTVNPAFCLAAQLLESFCNTFSLKCAKFAIIVDITCGQRSGNDSHQPLPFQRKTTKKGIKEAE